MQHGLRSDTDLGHFSADYPCELERGKEDCQQFYPEKIRGNGIDMSHLDPRPGARSKLLDAALSVIRSTGSLTTTVDAICTAAGVTKGAFFHHFENKTAFGLAAAEHWSDTTERLFAQAPYHEHRDASDRIFGYLEFRKALLQGPVPEFVCFTGALAQDIVGSTAAIADAHGRISWGHAKALETDIETAMRDRHLAPDWSARSLALHTEAVFQGAVILAKTKSSTEVADESLAHIARYLTMLFISGKSERPP